MSNPLKVGIVGAGGITRAHLPAYLERPDRVQLNAVCDLVEPLAQELAKKAGIDAVYLDIDEMLRDADIEAVDICTTHNSHAPLAIAAAEAGKHVIVEKPMAISVQECRDMIAAADKAGTTLMVAQHLRYAPEARAAKRLLDDGKLGTVEAVRTELFGGGMRGRRRRRRQGERWMQDARRSGGGMMMSEQVHHIDLLRYYAGNVKRVNGVCKSLQEHMVHGAEDLVSATLEFESGAVGEVWAKGNAIVPRGRTYTIFGDQGVFYASTPTKEQREVEISGATPFRHFGHIMVALNEDLPDLDPSNPEDRRKMYFAEPPFKVLSTDGIDLPSPNYFINEILHFADCCQAGEEPLSSGRDNIGTMKIIMGIYESSRTGQPVNLHDL
ncbi:MAG: Gfo/Idh/MocA family oxidoreductase [Gammaproteobacteria bacterium]|nr:Gfo/Idh/MocA family oxidoreductase [Gammaproteobacteria bacterium]